MPSTPRRRRLRALALALLAAALPATAQTVMVAGTPHLAMLDPAPTATQRAQAIAALDRFAPTLVCIEALPGERIEALAVEPARHGELLRIFAGDALELGQRMQLRLAVAAASARAQAEADAARWDALDDAGRLRLVGLQLAGYEPWSALLNWSHLSASAREGAAKALGARTVERLDELLASPNEIAALVVPLARQRGHHRLCAVDSLIDEASTQALVPELMPMLSDPAITRGLEALQGEAAARWSRGGDDSLLALLRWHNSADYASRDRAAQWDIFRGDRQSHDAGLRRLMLWHARNGEIAAGLFRAVASAEGERVLLVIGAAHRPFLDAALAAQPWMRVVDPSSVLGDADPTLAQAGR